MLITSGRGSGKTATVDLLIEKGYKITIEHARHYLDTKPVLEKQLRG